MANNYNLHYNFIDVCTPDYLTDHHQREGEELIGIAYYNEMSYGDLAEEVVTEVLYNGNYEKLWAVLPSDDENARVLLQQLVIDGAIDGTVDCDLSGFPENDEVMVYGYFSWDN